MSNDVDRLVTQFETQLTQTCSLYRMTISLGTDSDIELGAWTLSSHNEKCLRGPLRVTDDMLAVGPLDQQTSRLFLPRTADIGKDDRIYISGDLWWTPRDPPIMQYFRGESHHLEMIITRKAIQDGIRT